MPLLWPILGGIAVTWLLKETDMAIPAFVWMVVFIVLLYVAPTLAWWMLGLSLALAVLAVLAAFWETVVGVILGFIMFFFLVIGLIHAL